MSDANILKMRHPLRPLMIVGTASGVGKSIITTGLCRIFRQDGYLPAPFKAQNITTKVAYTQEGLQVGLAQAIQAEAATVALHTDMNPLIRKPIGAGRSELVLHGKEVGVSTGKSAKETERHQHLVSEVRAAFDRLRERYTPIILEGAGSIVELNLKEQDFINMPMAKYADAATLLVADIDRGGLFASVYGTLSLLDPEERRCIKGVIINKFRGVAELFDEGRQMLEELCQVPVVGVVPYLNHLDIEEEDTDLTPQTYGAEGCSLPIEQWERRVQAYDRLAHHLRSHLDMPLIYRMICPNDSL